MLGDFRCVNAQQTNGVGRAIAERDNDRVAIKDLDHAHMGVCRASLLARPPPPDRGGGHDHQRHDGTPGDHGMPDTAIRL